MVLNLQLLVQQPFKIMMAFTTCYSRELHLLQCPHVHMNKILALGKPTTLKTSCIPLPLAPQSHPAECLLNLGLLPASLGPTPSPHYCFLYLPFPKIILVGRVSQSAVWPSYTVAMWCHSGSGHHLENNPIRRSRELKPFPK